MSFIKPTPSRLAAFAVGAIAATLLMVASAHAADSDKPAQLGSPNSARYPTQSAALDVVIAGCDSAGYEAHQSVVRAMRASVKKTLMAALAQPPADVESLDREVQTGTLFGRFLQALAESNAYAAHLVSAGVCGRDSVEKAAQHAHIESLALSNCVFKTNTLPGAELVVCDGKPYVLPH